MNHRLGLLFTVLIGGLVLRLSVTGEYLNYVRPVMRPWLIVSGAVLLFVAITGISVRIREVIRREEKSWRFDVMDDPEAGHEHVDHAGEGGGAHEHGAPRAAWLLILPVVVLLVFPSRPLGSFAATRKTGALQPASPSVPNAALPPPQEVAPPIPGAKKMEILDFLDSVYYDKSKSLSGVAVTMIGFVAPGDRAGDNFLLSRFMIACCAADARPVQVAVTGYQAYVPPPDTWVEVTGTWLPDPPNKQRLDQDGFPIPTLSAVRVARIRPPDNPYATFKGFDPTKL